MNNTIRRVLRGTCWIAALIIFVLGFGATAVSWYKHDFDLPYGLIVWSALAIIVLVLVGYWVGPLDARTLGRIAAQIEAVQAGQAQLREEFKAMTTVLEGLRADLGAASGWQATVASDIIERIAASEKRGAEVEVAARANANELARLAEMAARAMTEMRALRERVEARRHAPRPVKQRRRRGKGGGGDQPPAPDVVTGVQSYLAARDDLRREQGGGGVASG